MATGGEMKGNVRASHPTWLLEMDLLSCSGTKPLIGWQEESMRSSWSTDWNIMGFTHYIFKHMDTIEQKQLTDGHVVSLSSIYHHILLINGRIILIMVLFLVVVVVKVVNTTEEKCKNVCVCIEILPPSSSEIPENDAYMHEFPNWCYLIIFPKERIL